MTESPGKGAQRQTATYPTMIDRLIMRLYQRGIHKFGGWDQVRPRLH